MLRFLSTNFFALIISASLFAQTDMAEAGITEQECSNTAKANSEVVVNEKMIAKYEKFMASGNYVSLWETIKDYNFTEISGYYKTYKNFEFREGTTYPEIKMAYENSKEKENFAEEPISLKTGKATKLLTGTE